MMFHLCSSAYDSACMTCSHMLGQAICASSLSKSSLRLGLHVWRYRQVRPVWHAGTFASRAPGTPAIVGSMTVHDIAGDVMG